MRSLTLFALAAAALSISGQVCGQRSDAALLSERASLYQWLDTLGDREILSGQFIRADNWLPGSNGQRLHEHFSYGFAEESGVSKGRFVSTELDREDYSDPLLATQYDCKAVTLESWAKQFLLLKKEDPEDPWDMSAEQGLLRDPIELLVLSRACDARGLKKLAAEFYLRSKAAQPSYGEGLKAYPAFIRDRIAEREQYGVLAEIGDTTKSWVTVLDDFHAYAKHFAGTQPAPGVAKEAQRVAAIVAERKAHPVASAEALASLQIGARIRELIFELPDQHGTQWVNPGVCDVFNDSRRDQSPASQLVKIGLPAVPALINALSDERISRSTHEYRGEGTPDYTIQVKIIALRILQKISNRTFDKWEGNEDYIEPGDAAEVRRSAEAWFALTSNEGEEQALLYGVRNDSGMNAYRQAWRLAEAYPKDAVAPIEAATKDPKNDDIQAFLMEILTHFQLTPSSGFAEYMLDHGVGTDARLAALKMCLGEDRTSRMDWLIDESKKASAGERTSADLKVRDVIELLANSGKAAAIELLEDEIETADTNEKFQILSGFCTAQLPQGDPNYRSEVERLLVSQLKVTDRWMGGGSIGSLDITDVRICDLSAYALACQFPVKYHFAQEESFPEMDRQRFTDMNGWREAHGRLPEPFPVKKVVTRSQSCTVSVVNIGGRPDVAPDIANRALTWKGKELTVKLLLAFIKNAADKWPLALHRLTIKLTRESYGDGIALDVDFDKVWKGENEWDVQEQVVLGSEQLLDSGVGESEPNLTDPVRIATVLASDPYESFWINISVDHRGQK